MPRVLVTGTAGFIGSRLAGRCLYIGMEVIATDDLPIHDAEPRFSPHFAAADRLAEPSNHTGTHALRMSTVQPECEPLDEVHDRPKTLVNARSGLRRIAARSGLLVDNRIRHLRSFLTHGLTVVVYHEVTERPSEFQKISGGFTTPELFEQQVDWIGERFTPISPMDLPQLGGTGSFPLMLL